MILKKITLIYIAAIVVLHVMPLGSEPALDRLYFGPLRGDYFFHTLVFLPWMGLAWLRWPVGSGAGRYILKWLVIGLILAGSAESLQLMLSYRSFNPLDLMFNLLGVLLGTLIFLRKKEGDLTKIR